MIHYTRSSSETSDKEAVRPLDDSGLDVFPRTVSNNLKPVSREALWSKNRLIQRVIGAALAQLALTVAISQL